MIALWLNYRGFRRPHARVLARGMSPQTRCFWQMVLPADLLKCAGIRLVLVPPRPRNDAVDDAILA